MSEHDARRLLLAAAVAGLVLSIIGALLEATRWTTPVAVGLLMFAAALDVQARARGRRERRERQRDDDAEPPDGAAG